MLFTTLNVLPLLVDTKTCPPLPAYVLDALLAKLKIYPLLEPIISGQNTELGVVIYANSITLTPGTVTLSTEDNKLLVHALDIKFMRDLQDGTMDRKVGEIII